jgi:hypothetical protein
MGERSRWLRQWRRCLCTRPGRQIHDHNPHAQPSRRPCEPTMALHRVLENTCKVSPAEEEGHSAQPQVALAVALAVQRVQLRVCVQISHALDIHADLQAVGRRNGEEKPVRDVGTPHGSVASEGQVRLELQGELAVSSLLWTCKPVRAQNAL